MEEEEGGKLWEDLLRNEHKQLISNELNGMRVAHVTISVLREEYAKKTSGHIRQRNHN
jgi:hypothetical protein